MTHALVIGHGSIGQLHAAVLEELGCEVAVVSRRTGVHPRTFADVATAVDRFEPDYAVVATETVHHMSALRALRAAGFDDTVLVEKPLRDVADAPLDARDGTVFVGFNLRFHPAITSLRRALDGVQVHTAEVVCSSYLPHWRTNRDYRLGASASRAAGGGVLRDLSHELDLTTWLLGPWRRMAALGGKLSSLEIETEDAMSMLLETERCQTVTICLNYLDREPRRGIHLTTSAGSFHLDLLAGRLTDVDGRILEQGSPPREQTYADQHRAVLSGRPAQCCTAAEGEGVVAMIAAAAHAAGTGTWTRNET